MCYPVVLKIVRRSRNGPVTLLPNCDKNHFNEVAPFTVFFTILLFATKALFGATIYIKFGRKELKGSFQQRMMSFYRFGRNMTRLTRAQNAESQDGTDLKNQLHAYIPRCPANCEIIFPFQIRQEMLLWSRNSNEKTRIFGFSIFLQKILAPFWQN